LALGGNKTRKLEFLVAEALANGAKTLITAGAVQSNHCRQTAAAAARFGLECILVLTGEPPAKASGNLLLDTLLGARFIWTTRKERDTVLKYTFDQAWEIGKRPYLVPYGGSSVTGACAYAYAIQEMLEQSFHPDWIVFASSSGGTQAGLVLGARIFEFRGQLLGISIDEAENVLSTRVASLATSTSDFVGEPSTFTEHDISVNADYLGQGYGVMGASEKEAIYLFARHEGVLLDPVYTGRAAAGMVNLIRKGTFKADETILFWHTGGAPALFADKYQDLAEYFSS
jgi:1-aminocyclopropane-1-carboxylate deaminase/D-cysteine desulfhydrase-like pyridoxal-dependent ACC family enzyme